MAKISISVFLAAPSGPNIAKTRTVTLWGAHSNKKFITVMGNHRPENVACLLLLAHVLSQITSPFYVRTHTTAIDLAFNILSTFPSLCKILSYHPSHSGCSKQLEKTF